jgi:hypothetical protein
MARTPAGLPEGTRITDYISLGVVTRSFPVDKVKEVLAATGTTSKRQRDLPAHVVVYYVLALALFMEVSYGEVLRCLLEGIRWMLGPSWTIKVTGKSGISQARTRLGWKPLQMLHDQVVRPIALRETRGAWYRDWRLVSLDGSGMDVADTKENAQAFGRPSGGRGTAAFPQLRFVSLVENGTHVLFGSRMGGYHDSEQVLARSLFVWLREGILCLADRNFFGFELWKEARETCADLLWRVKKSNLFPCETALPDGSYLSTIYPSARSRRRRTDGIIVRVIQYELRGVPDAEPLYRLVTTILDPDKAPAEELAALYRERWEIETALDELKTHLRGSRIVLRSKTPDLVRQEFYGLLMTHFAVRALMHEAALEANENPTRLSFVHSVRVIRRRLPAFVAIPPSGQEILS